MVEARTRMPVEARRAQLLELGFGLFSERPFSDVSVDEIADRAGISKGLLYHYFPSKRELYVACVKRAVEQLHEAVEPDESVPQEQRLAAGLDAFIDYVERDLKPFRNLLRGGNTDDPEIESMLSDMRGRMTRRLAAGIGIDAPDPVTLYCLVGYVGSCTFTCMAWAERGGMDRRALRHILADQLRAALRSAATLTEDDGVRARIEAVEPLLVLEPS